MGGVNLVVALIQHHVRNVVLRVHDEHQCYVHDRKDAVERHAQEVDGAGGLAVAEQPDVAGEAAAERGAHNGPGGDHQRRHNEHHGEVHELLKGIVRLEVLNGGHLEARVDCERVPCLGENLPGGGYDTPPLPGCEQQGHIDQAVHHPNNRG